MNNRTSSSGLFILTVFLTAFMLSCSNHTNKEGQVNQNPADSTNGQLHTEDTVQVSKTPSLPLEDGDYSIDLSASKIEWFCVIHKGYTLLKEGHITVVNNKITGGDFKILMDSIVDIDIDYYLMKATLENTLKSDMFFDVKKYPVSIFTITSTSDKGGNRYYVTGDLKIKDIVKPISFISTITTKNDTLLAKSDRFSINRTDWGVTIYSKNYPQTDDSFLFTDFIDFVITLVMTKD